VTPHSIVISVSRWLNRYLYGAQIARDSDQTSQYDAIGIAYVINMLLIGSIIFVCLAGVRLLGLAQASLSSYLGMTIAVSNVGSFVLTCLCSLSWTADRALIQKLRRLADERGHNRLFRWRVIFSVVYLLLSVLSFWLMMELFYRLSFGMVMFGLAINILLLQGQFLRRSMKNVEMGGSVD